MRKLGSTLQLFTLSTLLISACSSYDFDNPADLESPKQPAWNLMKLTQTGIGEVEAEWAKYDNPSVAKYFIYRSTDGTNFAQVGEGRGQHFPTQAHRREQPTGTG